MSQYILLFSEHLCAKQIINLIGAWQKVDNRAPFDMTKNHIGFIRVLERKDDALLSLVQ